MRPAPIAQIANLELDVFSGKWTTLMHLLILDCLLLLFLRFNLLKIVLFASVVVVELGLRITFWNKVPLGWVIVLLTKVIHVIRHAHHLVPLVIHIRSK